MYLCRLSTFARIDLRDPDGTVPFSTTAARSPDAVFMNIIRVYNPPAPQIDPDAFRTLLQKRRLSLLRADIESGCLDRSVKPKLEDAAENSDDGDLCTSATSVSASQRSDESCSKPGPSVEKGATSRQTPSQTDGSEALQRKLRRQRHLAQLAKAEEGEELQRRQSALVHQVEALKQQLDGIKKNKHGLVQDLKQVLLPCRQYSHPVQQHCELLMHMQSA